MNSFDTRTTRKLAGRQLDVFLLPRLQDAGWPVERLPFSIRILLENVLRAEDGTAVTREDVEVLARWSPSSAGRSEVAFAPARVLLQDFTGVPALVDLAAMREAMAALGGEPRRIRPLSPVELVVDHSIQVDAFGSPEAFAENERLDFARNRERYAFLRWGQRAFDGLEVVPPNSGIVHQVNLERLARVVCTSDEAGNGPTPLQAYPDTLVGTDSHTPMVNGIGVLGWGVGGIEAEAALLGQPISMMVPSVVGFQLTGQPPEGVLATDVVLAVTEILRRKGVVGAFVEFFGPGLARLTVEDRATIANMSPEYGATCAYFPVDDITLGYLRVTGRPPDRIALAEAYFKEQGLYRTETTPDPEFSSIVTLDLSTLETSVAGPRRPHDRVALTQVPESFRQALPSLRPSDASRTSDSGPHGSRLDHGTVVIAAITSCTNTSNPSVMLAAGLLARKAAERGLARKPWVKTSFAPGSRAVKEYLAECELTPALERLGFHLVAYGCTTCIGNSGPLPPEIAQEIERRRLVVCAVLSGNRNFEGRIHPDVRATT